MVGSHVSLPNDLEFPEPQITIVISAGFEGYRVIDHRNSHMFSVASTWLCRELLGCSGPAPITKL